MIKRFCMNSWPQSHLYPTASSFFVSMLWMRDALHPVCCLCSFHVKASWSKVIGWNVFACVKNQKLYAPKINQNTHISNSIIFVTPAFLFNSSFVTRVHSMSFYGHIVTIYFIPTIYVKIV